MGRTVQTTNQLILSELSKFSNFRRALRLGDQKLLDTLFVHARQHTAAISLADHALPFESMLLAMMLEQEREIQRLRQLLDVR
jgi:hypothetical protein